MNASFTDNAHNRVGLGTFPLSGVYNPISLQKAKALVEYFLELGGYYIDTAPMYGCGKVETLLGDVLRHQNRSAYYLVTKCGKDINPLKNEVVPNAGYDDVIRQCNESLERLKTDYIDLYLIHSPDRNTPYEETVRAMLDLKEAGKVREIGVSNVTLDELKEYRNYADIRFVQNRFSYINRSFLPEYQEYLEEHDIRLIPYEVLELGQLTGSILDEVNFGINDVRGTSPFFQGNPLSETRRFVKQVIFPLAKRYGFSVAQAMIAWALTQPQVLFPLVGTTRQEYLRLDLNAARMNVSESFTTQLEEAYRDFVNRIQTKYRRSIKDFRGLNDRYYSSFDFKKYNIF